MPSTDPQDVDAYILDTCKLSETGMFLPGAITYKGRKKIETIQWKDRQCATQEEADAVVREHFQSLGVREAGNEGELKAYA